MTYKRKDERHNIYRLRNPDPIDNTWHFKLNDIFPTDMLEYIINITISRKENLSKCPEGHCKWKL